MNPRNILIAIGILLIAAGLIGCTDKTKNNPTRAAIPEGLDMQANDRFFAIFMSTVHDLGHRGVRFYLPPDYSLEVGRHYPTLYLLSPFRADERYFFEHGLKTVADRLIAEGKIQPMVIVTFDSRSYLGGSFCVNSPRQGNFFDALFYDFYGFEPWGITGRALITKIEGSEANATPWVRAIRDREHRAIGGVGMGGYGAFKAAIETDLFGSVSAVNAPLDFDGAGSGGFLSLFQEVFPAGTQWIYLDSLLQIDTTFAVNPPDSIISIDTTIVELDTLGFGVDTILLNQNMEPIIAADPEMVLTISAAAAFSPHHTAFNVDSIYYDQFDVLVISTTVTDTLTDDFRGYLPNHDVHLPFDSTGAHNDLVWQLWMNNNIESLYANADPDNAAYFDGMAKLLVRSDGARFHYDEQMDGFVQFLNANAIDYQLTAFTGNDLLSGMADHCIYDLLEDILIFHSDNFGE
jgi:hypothetical protein